jgi:hypothetical protein
METKKPNNVTHIFTILFIKLTTSKMEGSEVFQILQGIYIAEYHAYFKCYVRPNGGFDRKMKHVTT